MSMQYPTGLHSRLKSAAAPFFLAVPFFYSQST